MIKGYCIAKAPLSPGTVFFLYGQPGRAKKRSKPIFQPGHLPCAPSRDAETSVRVANACVLRSWSRVLQVRASFGAFSVFSQRGRFLSAPGASSASSDVMVSFLKCVGRGLAAAGCRVRSRWRELRAAEGRAAPPRREMHPSKTLRKRHEVPWVVPGHVPQLAAGQGGAFWLVSTYGGLGTLERATRYILAAREPRYNALCQKRAWRTDW